MSLTPLQSAEKLCLEAQNCLAKALKNEGSLLIQTALVNYQEVLSMDLNMEEPYLGLAYLTLCAEDFAMTERLLTLAESINPASVSLHQLKKSLKKERKRIDSRPRAEENKLIQNIKRIQNPQDAMNQEMPRPLQRILGPIEGLFDSVDELNLCIEKSFNTHLSPYDSGLLYQYLKTVGSIELAATLKGLQSVLSQVAPQFQRKMPSFAIALVENKQVQSLVLNKAILPMTEDLKSIESFRDLLQHQDIVRDTNNLFQSLFEAGQTALSGQEAEWTALLNQNILETKNTSHRLRDLYLWLTSLHSYC